MTEGRKNDGQDDSRSNLAQPSKPEIIPPTTSLAEIRVYVLIGRVECLSGKCAKRKDASRQSNTFVRNLIDKDRRTDNDPTIIICRACRSILASRSIQRP